MRSTASYTKILQLYPNLSLTKSRIQRNCMSKSKFKILLKAIIIRDNQSSRACRAYRTGFSLLPLCARTAAPSLIHQTQHTHQRSSISVSVLLTCRGLQEHSKWVRWISSCKGEIRKKSEGDKEKMNWYHTENRIGKEWKMTEKKYQEYMKM
jgi:hypothetical protein